MKIKRFDWVWVLCPSGQFKKGKVMGLEARRDPSKYVIKFRNQGRWGVRGRTEAIDPKYVFHINSNLDNLRTIYC